MFKRIFRKFFKQADDDSIAKVSYLIKRGEESPTVDIVIEDYSGESMNGLVKILQTVHSDSCLVETVNIIVENLRSQGKEEEVVELCMKLGNSFWNTTEAVIAQKEISKKVEEQEEEPCIKPSDMLQ